MEGTTGFSADQVLASYRLVQRLGAGGFSEVWLAIDEGPLDFRKKVALKLLPRAAGVDQRNLDALVNEARVGCHLHHPHIVDMYRIGSDEGTWFIAMEYVEGRDLSRLLADLRACGARLPWSAQLEIGLGMARALDYAHQAATHEGRALRLVHRDIKPANVMLSDRGEVKVADFGIAKAITTLNTTTRSGQFKGTPAYAPPEAWEGRSTAHPRSDLFSLGATLYEMATGERLFHAHSAAAIVGQVVHGDADAEAARVARDFPAMAGVVRLLLERNPEARCQQAREVVDALWEVRRAVEAPCDLEFLMSLARALELPPSDRSQAIGQLALPETGDHSWRELFGRVTGQPLAAKPRNELSYAETEDSRQGSEDSQPDAVSAEVLTLPTRGPSLTVRESPALETPPRTHESAAPPPLFRPVGWFGLLVLVTVATLTIGLLVRDRDTGHATNAPLVSPGTEPTAVTGQEEDPATPAPRPTTGPVAIATPAPTPCPVDIAEEPELEPLGEAGADSEAEGTPLGSGPGAVVFASKTSGEQIWIDGHRADFLARRKSAPCREFPPGPLEIRMGSRTDFAKTTVAVRAGVRLVVECDLLVTRTCAVREEAGRCQ